MEYAPVTVVETRSFRRRASRLVYYFQNRNFPLYLLEMFGKNEKVDLTGAERNQLRKLVSELVKSGYENNE